MVDTRRDLSSLQTLYADNTAGDISAQDLRDGVQSMHGAKLVQTAAFASEPSTDPLAGDLFLPNNGVYLERYSGAAWVPWGPIYPLTKPVDGDFSWVNQGTSTVTTTQGGITLTPEANGGANIRIRTKTAPATPYTITVCMIGQWGTAGFWGIGWRESSSGKLHNIYVGNGLFNIHKWTNPTTFAANYTTVAYYFLPTPIWLRITDNGTNRICSASADGQNYWVMHTIGRTDFITADQVNFFTDPRNSSVSGGVTILSWEET